MLCILYPSFLYIVWMQGWRTTAIYIYIYIYKMLTYIVWWLRERQYSFYLFPPLWIWHPCGRQSSHWKHVSHYALRLPSYIHNTTREIYNPLFNTRWTADFICICLSCLSCETNRMRLYHHSSPKGILNFIKILYL